MALTEGGKPGVCEGCERSARLGFHLLEILASCENEVGSKPICEAVRKRVRKRDRSGIGKMGGRDCPQRELK
jgi:hypothetical protein